MRVLNQSHLTPTSIGLHLRQPPAVRFPEMATKVKPLIPAPSLSPPRCVTDNDTNVFFPGIPFHSTPLHFQMLPLQTAV